MTTEARCAQCRTWTLTKTLVGRVCPYCAEKLYIPAGMWDPILGPTWPKTPTQKTQKP